MNYIYDIIVNFNEELYEFFEWNKEDVVEHIRKIPHFVIESNKVMELKRNKVVFDKNFLTRIKNKTEIFTDTGISIISYAAIFTDDKTSIILELDKSGEIIKRSDLLLDEEEEILENFKDEYQEINYEVIEQIPIKYDTRYERKIKKYINDEIDNLYKNENKDKLKFLYNEWFNTINEDIKEIYIKLKSILNSSIDKKHVDFFNLIKLTNKERI